MSFTGYGSVDFLSYVMCHEAGERMSRICPVGSIPTHLLQWFAVGLRMTGLSYSALFVN